MTENSIKFSYITQYKSVSFVLTNIIILVFSTLYMSQTSFSLYLYN